MKILNKSTRAVIYEDNSSTIKATVEAAVSLRISLESADLRSADLRCADLDSADLRSADLRSADLRSADLRSADLRSADLDSADLRSADLRSANLNSADLRSADLDSADLRSADLRSADLDSADLDSANLDFSPGLYFSCKTFNIKAGLRLAAQLAYHFCRIDFKDCEDAKKAQQAIVDLANQFHRVDECGKIVRWQK